MFVQGSSRLGPNELGSPFGYLKVGSALSSVNLYIMPYNYLELSTLLSTSLAEKICRAIVDHFQMS